jgi:hypothetical protein
MSDDRQAEGDLVDMYGLLAAKLGEVLVDMRGSRAEYRRGPTLFATAEGYQAELRLDPEVAEAARRTPSTGASQRGPDWVVFAPPELDQHARDRAEAWFLSAWRHAGRLQD